MRDRKWHKYFCLVGLCDALNGVFIVFSSILSRVSGPLQAVLGQTMIIFTFIFSRFILQKVYHQRMFIGPAVVLFGVMISLVPVFRSVAEHEAGLTATAWWWPFVFLAGQVPGALMNIFQEKMQIEFKKASEGSGPAKEFSVIYFQFGESFYQWAFISLFFVFDMAPNYGYSGSLSEFGLNFRSGFLCLANDPSTRSWSSLCAYNGSLAFLFITSFVLTYVFSTLATRHMSANFLTCVTAVPPILSLVFWFTFPGVNRWAGGKDITSFEAACNVVAMVIVLGGVFLYDRFDTNRQDKEPDVDGGAVELCCPGWGDRRRKHPR
jgi:drug/metabolite transporter (DMT)-like permease